MKNIALLITAVILSNFIFSQEFETTTDYYKNGVKKSEGMMHLGREMGHWQYFDSNGKLVRETDYYKGELYGNDITYYPNGNKNEEFTFESNLKNGSYKNWYESGVLRTEGFYKYDVKDSSWTTYYNTGKPEMEVLYNQGSGRIISFYSPKNEKTVANGNGTVLRYYEFPSKLSEGSVADGLEQGLWTYYFENGNIKETGTFDN